MNQLKTLRKELMASQQEIAETLGISRITYMKYEKLEQPPKHILYAVKWLNYCNKSQNIAAKKTE